jgi:hypothetical protein
METPMCLLGIQAASFKKKNILSEERKAKLDSKFVWKPVHYKEKLLGTF